jgi:hypothetical protein
MYAYFYRLFILVILTVPAIVSGQVIDRATVEGERIPSHTFHSPEEPKEFHYTPVLIGSDEGQRALQELREMDHRDYPRLRAQQLQSSIGSVRDFFVRNIEESTPANPVWEEIEFELVRAEDNAEIWVQVEELSEDKVSDEILDLIWNGLINETPANSIDPNRGIVDLSRELFGSWPEGGHLSGTLKVLIADINDGWDPPEQNFFTAGFFDPVDLSATHQNSNQATIIYINSKPGIYRPVDGENRLVNPRLSTMSHELQHLIHSNYGELSLFQNEGQSELAEILMGYNARAMTFLDSGAEMRGEVSGDRWVYRFRSQQPESVLYDYQRAQLLHSYLEERVGSEAAGSLTRSTSPNDDAYRQVLQQHNISTPEFFTDFYVSAYANNRVQGMNAYRFSRPQLTNIRTSNPGVFYNAEVQPWVTQHEEELYYGGALYTQWFGVEDWELDIRETDGISQDILYRMVGDSQYSHIEAGPGVFRLDENGIYEEIVLISVNHEPAGSSASPHESRTFQYDGIWTTTNLILEPLSYHGNAAAFVPIPDQFTDTEEIYSVAMRISPDFDSGIQSVRFNINERETAVQGESEIAITLRESEERTDSDGNLIYIPSPEPKAVQIVHSSNISTGENYIGVNSSEWTLESGEEYFVTIDIAEDPGNFYLEFLVDNGTESDTDPDYNPLHYNPLRTFIGIRDDSGPVGWLSFTNNNNMLIGVNLVGFKETEEIYFPNPPIADTFELVKNFPNPFNSGTIIEYNVPEEAHVQITIHDILGREVTELLNSTIEPGLHEIRFDAGNLASGLYFYKLTSPSGIQTRKMLLVK